MLTTSTDDGDGHVDDPNVSRTPSHTLHNFQAAVSDIVVDAAAAVAALHVELLLPPAAAD